MKIDENEKHRQCTEVLKSASMADSIESQNNKSSSFLFKKRKINNNAARKRRTDNDDNKSKSY